MNRFGFAGAHLFTLCDDIERGTLRIVIGFSFHRRDVADGFRQPAIVEVVYPFERRHFDSLYVFPNVKVANDRGLVKFIDCLDQSVVIAVSAASNGGIDACVGQASV
jgi:hypothetical protein